MISVFFFFLVFFSFQSSQVCFHLCNTPFSRNCLPRTDFWAPFWANLAASACLLEPSWAHADMGINVFSLLFSFQSSKVCFHLSNTPISRNCLARTDFCTLFGQLWRPILPNLASSSPIFRNPPSQKGFEATSLTDLHWSKKVLVAGSYGPSPSFVQMCHWSLVHMQFLALVSSFTFPCKHDPRVPLQIFCSAKYSRCGRSLRLCRENKNAILPFKQ